jgi:hypothetical protein
VSIPLADFPERVLRVFPALGAEFAYGEGLPYVQMGAFARLMQCAQGSADWDVYARAARLTDELWRDADEGLRNALNVSLLECIDFDGPHGAKAWALLSLRLQRAWRAMAACNARLHSGANGPPPEAE